MNFETKSRSGSISADMAQKQSYVGEADATNPLDRAILRIREASAHLNSMRDRLENHADVVGGYACEASNSKLSQVEQTSPDTKLASLDEALSTLEDRAASLQAQVVRNCIFD